MVRLVEAPLEVVPARVDNHAVVVDGRLELICLMRRDARDVPAFREHGVQREGRARTPVASPVATTPLGDERDAPVRQPARKEVVPVPGRELHEMRTVRIALEDVEYRLVVPLADLRLALRAREDDLLPVPRDVRREKPAVPLLVPAWLRDELAALPRTCLDHLLGQQVHELRVVRERLFEHIESVAVRRALQLRVETEELVADVRAPVELLGGKRLARDEEQLLDGLHERILERNRATEAHRLQEERTASILVLRDHGGGRLLQFRERVVFRLQVRFALQVVAQGPRPSQEDVQRIAVGLPHEGLTVHHLLGRRLEELHRLVAATVWTLHVPVRQIPHEEPPGLGGLLPLGDVCRGRCLGTACREAERGQHRQRDTRSHLSSSRGLHLALHSSISVP